MRWTALTVVLMLAIPAPAPAQKDTPPPVPQGFSFVPVLFDATSPVGGEAKRTHFMRSMLAAPDPNGPAFDIADVACWRRLLSWMTCGARAPAEMTGPLFPGVRSDLANTTGDRGKQND